MARAAEVLTRGLTRHATSEIAQEFPAHWGGKNFEVDGGALTGALRSLPSPGGTLRVGARTSPSQPTVGFVLTTKAELSFTEVQSRPDTVQQLLDWARDWDSALEAGIVSGFGDAGANDPLVLIQAPNGVIGARILVSGQGTRRVKAFLMGLRRGMHIEVAEATFQQPRDIATPSCFERIDQLHNATSQARWKASRGTVGLIGDWHSHPFGSGEASSADQSAWRRLSRAISAEVIGLILGDSELPAVYLQRCGLWPARADKLILAERTLSDLAFQKYGAARNPTDPTS